jgi:kumamolisin
MASKAGSENGEARQRARSRRRVCALADPRIGYRCYLDGQWTSVTDVGAAACTWAALLARLRQALGRPLGMVSGLSTVLGPDGALAQLPGAGPGWDSRTGSGAPDGNACWPTSLRPTADGRSSRPPPRSHLVA